MSSDTEPEASGARKRSWLRRLLTLSMVAVLAVTVVALLTCLAHRELIVGTTLESPAADDSVSHVFPRSKGWSSGELEDVRRYAEAQKSTALIVIHDGELVAEWGRTSKPTSVHSVRKSIVSVLYGIAAARGLIDIDATLSDLNVDDEPPLSKTERTARLRDLLTARSGIYHDSVRDDGGDARPPRGSHLPDEAFYYNNWSFNAVGTIFEQQTGMRLGAAFKQWIADPLGMQDFRVEDVRYESSDASIFPAYRFWMSARDLARFGVLIQQRGRWGDQQIVPEAWIDESTTSYSDVGQNGYGLMWWIRGNGDWMATGTGGQKLIIDPNRNLVLVNRVDTGEGIGRALWSLFGPRMNNTHMDEIKQRILAAGPSELGRNQVRDATNRGDNDARR